MKKIVSLILVVALSCLMLAACTPATSEYSLAIAVDTSVSETGKVVNTAASLVIDKDGKIVSCRIDCAELTPTATDGVLNAVTSVTTKVEMGDSYDNGKMPAGNWAKQTKAFEDAIVGKTAKEVAELDMALVSGCTMQSTPAVFKAVIAKAFASTAKVTFSAGAKITHGLAISEKFVAAGKVQADYAAVVVEGGKVVACAIDSNEVGFTVNEDSTLTAGTYGGTKTELGDNYDNGKMPAGNWAKQARAFADAVTGKTAEELEAFEPVSDALAQAGCTMQNTTVGYKATIIKAFGYAR